MTPSGAAVWIEAARPKTLPAAVIPVLVGSALAYRWGYFSWVPAMVCLVFALLVQIGTNFANDYGDFVNGADQPDRLGPRRAVAAGLIQPAVMAQAAIGVFVIAFLCGIGLVWLRGWELLPIGIASLLFGWGYTSGPYPLAYHGLGDVFVFVFFGLVAVGGTFYVQSGVLVWAVIVAAVPVGLLATNILVVNNLRDVETDARAGKKTTVVLFGRAFALRQYAWSMLTAFAVPVLFAVDERKPWLALPLILAPFGYALFCQLTRGGDGPTLNRLLAKTASLLLFFGVIWAAVLAFTGEDRAESPTLKRVVLSSADVRAGGFPSIAPR